MPCVQKTSADQTSPCPILFSKAKQHPGEAKCPHVRERNRDTSYDQSLNSAHMSISLFSSTLVRRIVLHMAGSTLKVRMVRHTHRPQNKHDMSDSSSVCLGEYRLQMVFTLTMKDDLEDIVATQHVKRFVAYLSRYL